jgi:hypothetical protein
MAFPIAPIAGNNLSDIDAFSRIIPSAHTIPFSIYHKVADNLCGLGTYFRSISSAHTKVFRIAHTTANILF